MTPCKFTDTTVTMQLTHAHLIFVKFFPTPCTDQIGITDVRGQDRVLLDRSGYSSRGYSRADAARPDIFVSEWIFPAPMFVSGCGNGQCRGNDSRIHQRICILHTPRKLSTSHGRCNCPGINQSPPRFECIRHQSHLLVAGMS